MKRFAPAFTIVFAFITGLALADESPIVGRLLDAVSVWIVNGEVCEEADPVVAAVKAGETGTFDVIGYKKKGGGKAESWRITITKSDAPLPPTPIIVDPVKPDVPPTPAPITSGKRFIVIMHESAETTPEIGTMITLMRNGDPSKKLAEKGHTLKILDDDAKDQFGRPSKEVEQWRPQFAGVKLPAVIVGDLATMKVITVESIASSPGSSTVMEIVRKAGG